MPSDRCAHLLIQRGEGDLERTIVGALAIDYPNFRVWMLDDCRRDWLKTLCGQLGCHYLSRSDNAHEGWKHQPRAQSSRCAA
jgi:hypothetical protein